MKNKLFFFKLMQFSSAFFLAFMNYISIYWIESYFHLGNVSILFNMLSIYIPFITLSFYIGYIIDKYPYSVIIQLLYKAVAILLTILVIMFFYLENKHLYIFVLSLFVNIISFVISLLIDSLIPKVFNKQHLLSANSTSYFYKSIGSASGVIIAGIITYIDVFFCVIFCILLYSIILLKSKSVLQYKNIDNQNEPIVFDIKLMIKSLFINNVMRYMVIHGFLTNIIYGVIEFGLYLLLSREMSIDGGTIAFLYASRQAGGIISTKIIKLSYIRNRINISLIWLVIFNGILWTLLPITDGFKYSYVILMLIFFSLGFNSMLFNLTMTTIRQNQSSFSEQGRVLAVIRFFLFLSYPIGIIIGYFLIDLANMRTIYIISGLLILISSFIIFPIRNKLYE